MFTLHFTDNITTQRWHLLHKRVCQRLIYLFSSRSKEYHFKNNEEKLCCQVVSISAIDMLFLLSKERWQLNSSRVELKALHLLVQDQAMYHLLPFAKSCHHINSMWKNRTVEQVDAHSLGKDSEWPLQQEIPLEP